MSVNPTPQPKPPRDYLAWIYWIPFLLIVSIGIFLIARKPTYISLPFLKHEVTAYYLIKANDVYVGSVDANIVTSSTIRNLQDLIGHYTLSSILADKPILGDQIGPKPESRLITNTLAVAIPANSTTLLGGNLHAGDIVSIASVPLSNAPTLPRIVFDSILVLDVKQSPQNQAVIILAIPTYRWPSFLAEMQGATVVLALREE